MHRLSHEVIRCGVFVLLLASSTRAFAGDGDNCKAGTAALPVLRADAVDKLVDLTTRGAKADSPEVTSLMIKSIDCMLAPGEEFFAIDTSVMGPNMPKGQMYVIQAREGQCKGVVVKTDSAFTCKW